jgi:prepilin-type N-terminal cleavage/methylation domain-containing protein
MLGMSRQNQHGFSLIEMAMVVVIMALLLGAILTPLATQVHEKRISETKTTLDDINQALIGYAASHSSTGSTPQPYLPCPDLSANPASNPGTGIVINDGLEDRYTSGTNAGKCVSYEGNLPWQTLGVGATDAWGNRFHYKVTTAYADSNTGFGLGTAGYMQVCTDASCTTTIATSLPVIILSYGKNGYGAVNGNTAAGTSATNTAPTSADELENTNLNSNFVSRIQTPPVDPNNCGGSGQPACEFDDVVDWISSYTLFSQMISAGKLP